MNNILYIDELSWVIIGLVTFIGINVAYFSNRYLEGDLQKRTFYKNLFIMTVHIFMLVLSNHILLFFISWGMSNFFLTKLMLHKKKWQAAKESSNLAFYNFLLGLVFLGSAFLLIYSDSKETSIQNILNYQFSHTVLFTSSVLIFLCAMTQSAIWPFHKWLISSLNSPTPVSAVMHAGLINGGGFLLVKFSPLLLQQPILLNFIFITGVITALTGTLWKLMQNDVKRMLACSTMGQMGFMFAQCGLGLYSAAVAHLCWHGVFKANLFLSSGDFAKQKTPQKNPPPTLLEFLIGCFFGVIGAYGFHLVTGNAIFEIHTTNFFLLVVISLAGIQFAISLMKKNVKLPMVLLLTFAAGILYGANIYLIEYFTPSLDRISALPLNFIHIIALLALTTTWAIMLFQVNLSKNKFFQNYIAKFYIFMLNASQPHKKTITSHRKNYQF